jgi:endonuclease-3
VLTILNQLVEEGHMDGDQPSLDYLWELPTGEAKKQIVRFNGVGPKTAACVLMFAMRRAEFPVDTHVWKVRAHIAEPSTETDSLTGRQL